VYGTTGDIGSLHGSLATVAAVDADLRAIKPKKLSMRKAAALPLVFIIVTPACSQAGAFYGFRSDFP
jgi:NADPH:quinone reductase-like Zn-dependent oxidoreductase